tara:strand:- start:54 stop:695 length:642 start_codon:yes stop_codon:yes gene_type:complete
MKNIILIITLIVFTSCISKKQLNKIEPTIDVKPIEFCEELPNIVIYFNEYINTNNLLGLSFAQAYYIIESPFDSLSLQPLRFKNQNHIAEIVKKEFPKIEVVHSERLQNMKYSEQMNTSINLKGTVSGSRYRIKRLVTESEGEKQLYITMTTRLHDVVNDSWLNSISLYVFDNKKYQLLYENSYTYKCDPRDSVALQKVIEYGLRKLKVDILE